MSALEVALKIQEEYFDVAVIGGGPIGLATAINLAKRNNKLKIVVIEQEELGNSEGSSGSSDTRQFRQMYDEQYLAEFAINATGFWEGLEIDANLTKGSLLNTNDGYLFFGDTTTGATTLVNLHSYSHGILLWRATLQATFHTTTSKILVAT